MSYVPQPHFHSGERSCFNKGITHRSVKASGTSRLKIFTCVSVTAEKDLENAQLVQILHRLLSDDRSAPEIKYNSMVLICALIGSGEYSGEATPQDLCMQYSSLLQLNTEHGANTL